MERLPTPGDGSTSAGLVTAPDHPDPRILPSSFVLGVSGSVDFAPKPGNNDAPSAAAEVDEVSDVGGNAADNGGGDDAAVSFTDAIVCIGGEDSELSSIDPSFALAGERKEIKLAVPRLSGWFLQTISLAILFIFSRIPLPLISS